MKSGHIGIFGRELIGGKPVKRLHIEEKYSSSIGYTFFKYGELDMQEMADFFARTLDHEVEYILLQSQ